MTIHMDENTATVLVVAIIAIAAVIALAIYRFTGGE